MQDKVGLVDLFIEDEDEDLLTAGDARVVP